jgi:hypothetical protein
MLGGKVYGVVQASKVGPTAEDIKRMHTGLF